jgi:hypothetical protein
MIRIFHGDNEQTHEAFQAWRRSHVNGFHMTEGTRGAFTIHWAQDKRENREGRGCWHQGGSGNRYKEDKGGCYTTARKVCAEDVNELFTWAASQRVKIRSCGHCDSPQFPFRSATRG